MELTRFSPKQVLTLSWWAKGSPYADCDGIICDGAVRSGKTLAMSLSFISWAMRTFDDHSFALCGKTIQSLRRNVVQPLLSAVSGLGFNCHEKISKNLLEVSFGSNTNRFYFFGGRDEQSASLIQGITLAGVLFDEAALMPRSFVEQALARCSVQGSRFWFNCNPEHPYHWFYLEWIKKAKEKNILYLHFTMEDNPSLSPKILKRYKGLYSGIFYQRFIEGLWISSQGLIYPEMCSEDAFWDTPEEQFDEFYLSCDYGTVNPTSIGLWGKIGDAWYRIDEFYHDSRKTGVQYTDEEYYLQLETLAGGRDIRAVIVDPSAASFIQTIRRHGRFHVIPAKNDVLDGIRITAEKLRKKQLRICRCCKDAVREFSLYCWDTRGHRDSPKKEFDHAMDDIRYFAATVPDSRSEIFPIATSVLR